MTRYARLSWGFRWRMWRAEHPRRWRLGFDWDYLLMRYAIAAVIAAIVGMVTFIIGVVS